MNYLPNKLSKLRKHYNLSQSYLAEVLDVETIEYMSYENGSSMINYAQMKKLANLYHIDLIEIFTNSDEVTLYDEDTSTDQINIEYFTKKKSIFDTIKEFVSAHKGASTIIAILLVTIIILSIFLSNMSRPYTIEKENKNRLSVSETTVIYIDDNGNVLGSGSNENGQINNLSAISPIKVQEGEGFTIILNEDGSVVSFGLPSKYEKEVDDLKNIKDISVGDSHILAVDSSDRVICIGDNQSGACEVDGTKNINKIFATRNGSILLDNVGVLTYSGSFIGSSSLKEFYNVLDIASSNNILALLTSDNEVRVFTKNNNNYLQAESWKDIVDVACGDYFVAGLDQYGRVHIDIENNEIIQAVNQWSDIIAIDAGSDYLIGFDGRKIFGVGKNSYKQFTKEEIIKQTLPKVSNVTYTIDNNYVYVQFDGVSNASGYSVGINVGVGLSQRVESDDVVKFETESMTDGKTYTISITALGGGNYKDSDVYTLNFAYEKPQEMISIDDTKFVGRSVDDLITYLNSLGIENPTLKEVKGVIACDIETPYIISTNISGQSFTKSQLENMEIEYTCCEVDGHE